ncbi:MAG TPA: BREX-1 system adenine-specific DNA-methyltransferase PglX [bacterium]|nr:BREX-1 system adenine-specific DNA-methyltransferase PglX [bacterium]
MNTAQLKAYAPKARREFIQAVTERAGFYGLSKDRIEPVEVRGEIAFIGGKEFPAKIKEQRRKLEERTKRNGFEQVMEAAAYTWFNRFVALRYMEIHGYLNHGFRVLSHPDGGLIPEILEKAADVELPGLKKDVAIDLKLHGGKDEELYRMLLVAQCNALNHAMPFLFERIDDETELLMPGNLLHTDSLIRKLVSDIDESEWREVEIIGWIYQFYISEKKDEVIGKVVKSEDIPAATQLFTPKWIVKYLVQNTIGRQWLMTYPHSPLKAKMEYYIEQAEQTDEAKKQLAVITPKELHPEEITVLDPACGSGHILVEAYDLLKEIYLERGYRLRDIPKLILEKNLFGLDIDDRAAQLAGFALMMKARADDRSVLNGGDPVRLNVLSIQSSDGIDAKEIADVLLKPRRQRLVDNNELFPETERQQTLAEEHKPSVSRDKIYKLFELFENGKTFGSLIKIPDDVSGVLPLLEKTAVAICGSGDLFADKAADTLMPFVRQSAILSGKYCNVVANPPYMGNKYLNPALKDFLKDNYDGFEKDLFSSFIVRNTIFAKYTGNLGFMSPFVWMFIASYENLRNKLIKDATITSLIQLEYSGFEGATVPICTFTIANEKVDRHKSCFIRLSDFKGADNQAPKTLDAIRNRACGWFYEATPEDFPKIPGSPIAYWVKGTDLFKQTIIGDRFFSGGRNKTHGNEKYLRFFWEIQSGNNRWALYANGGDFRKYYGNETNVVDWSDSARAFYDSNGGLCNPKFWNREGITWSLITSAISSFRIKRDCVFYSSGSPTIFNSKYKCDEKALAFLNSPIAYYYLKAINPTLNTTVNDVFALPYIPDKIDQLVVSNVERCLLISEIDWNSYETSCSFGIFPLFQPDYYKPSLMETYKLLNKHRKETALEMLRLETENNRILIEAYGLLNEIKPETPFSEITLTCNPHYRYGGNRSEKELESLLLTDTIKELISYAVGCMMGRYCLDQPGLVYAESGNRNFDASKYKTFAADEDGIVPVMDMDWFPDDATNRFIEFLKVAWSPETLDENLKFVADSLSPKQDETPEETIRRYFSTGFFKDHLSTYRKRPIYWLFSSGKQKAFQCLVYLHRYNEGTLSRMRSEYVTPLQGKINARIGFLEKEIEKVSSTSAKTKFRKLLETMKKKQAELSAFDDELRHYADKRIAIDLDDGVKVNYGKFGNLLAEVKVVTGGAEE